ncbi:membrane-associated protein, putative, partial [Bodo saltans]
MRARYPGLSWTMFLFLTSGTPISAVSLCSSTEDAVFGQSVMGRAFAGGIAILLSASAATFCVVSVCAGYQPHPAAAWCHVLAHCRCSLSAVSVCCAVRARNCMDVRTSGHGSAASTVASPSQQPTRPCSNV